MKSGKLIKRTDIILIVIYSLLTAVLAYALLFDGGETSSRTLYIRQSGKTIEKITLPVANTIIRKIGDDVHANEIVIDKNKVYIKSASCHDHLCMEQGPAYKSGDMIVCLPNALILEIRSDNDSREEKEVDAVAK